MTLYRGMLILMPENNSTTDSWCVYILRCNDNTLYTGIARNLDRRLEEHNTGRRGAKYTRGRRPVTLLYWEPSESRSTATKREHEIRQLNAEEKMALCMQKNSCSQ